MLSAPVRTLSGAPDSGRRDCVARAGRSSSRSRPNESAGGATSKGACTGPGCRGARPRGWRSGEGSGWLLCTPAPSTGPRDGGFACVGRAKIGDRGMSSAAGNGASPAVPTWRPGPAGRAASSHMRELRPIGRADPLASVSARSLSHGGCSAPGGDRGGDDAALGAADPLPSTVTVAAGSGRGGNAASRVNPVVSAPSIASRSSGGKPDVSGCKSRADMAASDKAATCSGLNNCASRVLKAGMNSSKEMRWSWLKSLRSMNFSITAVGNLMGTIFKKRRNSS
mmetsp:Transcript_26655/g.61405  ORF Transcript_26655/g.61405 Transcript_26655/m.61405 type:complete len:282 (+) Transcript_26655:479-1324(+)